MRVCAVAALIVLCNSAASRAAFVNGVETFDGATLDLTTWERFDPTVTTFSQNGALAISGNGSYSDYTTRAVTVAVGQRVSAEVTVTVPNPMEPGALYSAGLFLTTNSAGTAADTFSDSRYLGCQITFDSSKTPVSRFQEVDDSGSSTFGPGVPVSAQAYVLSLARASPSQLAVTVSSPDGTPLFNRTYTILNPPGDMYVSLHRSNFGFFLNSAAVFDNVRISDVPEPASITSLGLAAVFACRRARKKVSGLGRDC